MIRLLIVDDQPSVRKGLRMRLAAEADLFGGVEDPALAARFPRMLDVVEAHEQAGRELATLGHICRATERRANQEIIPLPMFWLLKRFRPVKVLIIEQAKQYA